MTDDRQFVAVRHMMARAVSFFELYSPDEDIELALAYFQGGEGEG